MRSTNDRKRLALAIGALGEAYRQPVTEATIRAYEMALEDVPIVDVESAVKRALRERKFFPTAAELRELAGELAPADCAVIAWNAVVSANARIGYTGSVDFDDRAINAAVRSLGGWEAFTERVENDPIWARKDFDRAYQVYCRRGVTAAEGKPLGGFHDRSNHGRFPKHVPAPVLIATSLKPTPLLTREESSPAALPPAVAGYLEHVGAKP